MSDTRLLLSRIAALKQRIEQNHPRAALPAAVGAEAERVSSLEGQTATSRRHGALLDGSFRLLEEAYAPTATEPPALPRQLTARARRLLMHGQGLLKQLRGLAEHFASELREPSHELGVWSGIDPNDPLALRYHSVVAMLDTALRTVQAYPDSPSAQLRLCDGLDAVLSVVAERSAAVQAAVLYRRREAMRVETLAGWLQQLVSGEAVELSQLVNLAESLLADVDLGFSLRFCQVEPTVDPNAPHASAWLARTVACHSLIVAQVVARLVRHDPDLRAQPLEPVLAALVHDVGMLRIPVALLTTAGPLDDEQRRLVESHTRIGADLVKEHLPNAAWLSEACVNHHERMDGTGYPAGLREVQISPLARLLAVCDVYATLCAARPHRPAREPRTALTDTLLLADKGALDRAQAERLLQLSFYPVGSLIELADGALALVVATPTGRRDLNAPARPVVLLLTDGQGQWLPLPRHVSLAETEGRAVVRTLLPDERRRVLGQRYPELV
ncbi:MAG: HD domain-containing protein [Planctomycetia bacterium]|nr:HD domain-containing protein [Planctomycetia bacterium]